MEIFLTMLGVVFGAFAVFFVAFFIYNVFVKNALLKGKSIAEKTEGVLKKDMSSKCTRCTFYMNNDYDNGYSQSEWLKLFKESVADKEWDKNSEEFAEAVAPFINAIVIAEEGHYFRRGFEFIENTLTPFRPGYNDRISLNYFVEPYEYVENEVRRANPAQPKTTVSHNSSSDRLTLDEKRELDRAEQKYNFAIRMASRNPNREIAANEEKRAHAEYMRVLAKYAGKK